MVARDGGSQFMHGTHAAYVGTREVRRWAQVWMTRYAIHIIPNAL